MKNKLTKFFKNKIVLATMMLAASACITGAAINKTTLAEFGPDRPTKAYVDGSTTGFNHVQFNSFTGVPNFGDERKFFSGKIAGGPVGYYDPMNQVRDGNELLVRIYVHNNADASLNSAANNYKGIARNTTVRAEIPQNMASAHTAKAYISADNAQPKTIFDTLDINANYPFELDYVEGSAHLDSNYVNDMPLSDAIVNGGVKIGTDKLDGNIKGCFQYTAVVTFRVKVKAPNFKLDKSVRIKGEDSTKWREEAEVKPGDNVEWKLNFQNTGATQLNDVEVFDQLPSGLGLTSGSTKIYNASHPSGVGAGTDAVAANGINVGNYKPNSNAIVVFESKIPSEDKLACGWTKYTNKGFAKPKGQNIATDTAGVKVYKKCDVPEPKYSCDLLTATKTGKGREVKFTVGASASGGATVKEYVYNFGDGNSVTSTNTTVTHTYASDGNYEAYVTVRVNVNGQVKETTSANCKTKIEFKNEVEPKYSCDLLTATKTGKGREVKFTVGASASGGATVKEYVYNFGDGNSVTSTNTTVTHTYASDGNYEAYVTVRVNVNGQVKETTSANCKTKVKFESHPNYEIEKGVRIAGSNSQYTQDVTVEYGQKVEYRIAIKNTGDTKLGTISVKDVAPLGVEYVKGSLKVTGVDEVAGDLLTGGTMLLNGLDVGKTAYITYSAKVVRVDDVSCDLKKYRNIAKAHVSTVGEKEDDANVKASCEETKPMYECVDLTATKTGAGREVNFKASAAASGGASIKQYVYSFGDGSEDLTTDKTTVKHTYPKDGNYSARVMVQVSVDGVVRTADGDQCATKVSFNTPETPETPVTPVTPGKLPDTGAGSVIATFLGVVVASSLAYSFVRRFVQV